MNCFAIHLRFQKMLTEKGSVSMVRKVEFIGSGYEVVGWVFVDTEYAHLAFDAAEKWYEETGQSFPYCDIEIAEGYSYNEQLRNIVGDNDFYCPYWVRFDVDGHTHVNMRAESPYEAWSKALDVLDKAEMGSLEYVSRGLTSLKDAQGQLLGENVAGYDLSRERSREQVYSMGFSVDGLVFVRVDAPDAERAVQKACQKIGGLDLGVVTLDRWEVLNVEDSIGRRQEYEEGKVVGGMQLVDAVISKAMQQGENLRGERRVEGYKGIESKAAPCRDS